MKLQSKDESLVAFYENVRRQVELDKRAGGKYRLAGDGVRQYAVLQVFVPLARDGLDGRHDCNLAVFIPLSTSNRKELNLTGDCKLSR